MKTLLALFVSAATVIAACAAKPVVVGHRGSDIGVESTVEALEAGALRGYPLLESDVKVAADGTFVLCHDDSTTRFGGRRAVASSTIAELQSDTMRQVRWGRSYEGRMATLGDMLDVCRRHGCRPLIELKWATGINSRDTSGIPALIAFIDSAGMRDRCIILTSMKPCLEYIRANYPDVETQLLVQTLVDENFDWCVEHNMGIDMHHSVCTPERVGRFHAAGLPVNVWTVNDPADFARLAAMGCDYITTDSLPAR
ncbi:MAG: glycerophosphodiester phosphodiesterase family protein [Bacteroidales bacterium]|nr:glycerophosphodiester phosphodiesterase family protein [Bacteroidales bacterium]